MGTPNIIFEDDDIVVVDKPSGFIVYPDGKHDYPALSHWLEKKYPEFHFVHRIDRETSGVLVVAKTADAYAALKEQFQNREIKKVYRAFVHGALKEERGQIERPIGSARGGRGPRSATRPHGVERSASTVWKRLANGGAAAYIEAFPKTGRTHQIRVHCAAIQHPIIADVLYGPGRPQLLGFKRLAMNALSVTITLPSGKPARTTGVVRSGGEKTFVAPLPADFLKAEKELRA